MKIDYLRVPVDDVVFVFKKPRANDDLGSKSGSEVVKTIFSKLVKIEGEILDEDGKQIGEGEIREVGLPIDFVEKIIKAWNTEVSSAMGMKEIPEEKKPTTSA